MKAHAQMGDTVRRLLALAAVAALIAVGCSDDSGDSGTDDPTTTVQGDETTTTGTVAGDPTVYLAEGGTKAATSDSVALAGPFGGGVVPTVVPIGPIEPDLGAPVGTDISSARWTVLPQGQGNCAFATGQIVISKAAAEDFVGETGFEVDGETVFGQLASEDIVLAAVTPGSEIEYVFRAISEAGGIASLHYPAAPLPKWRFGPAAPAENVGTLPAVPAAAPTAPTVIVLDRFEEGRDVPAELTSSDQATRGHGEFIVGILARMGVAAEARNVVLTDDTVASEQTVAAALANTADNVTNVSLGIAPCEVTSPSGIDVTLPPIGIGAAMATRASSTSQPIVAAAGNHGDASACEDLNVLPWFPALFAQGATAWESYTDLLTDAQLFDAALLADDILALEGSTVSVGSIAGPGSGELLDDPLRASYSACGASAWAPGTNVISDYENELAVWSGTSFAAPQIAAAIALGLM